MAGKSRGNPVTDGQIVAHYAESRSGYKTAMALGIGATTVHRVLLAQGVPMTGLEYYREQSRNYRGMESEVRRLYEAGATCREIGDKLSAGGPYSVKQALKRAGGILRENRAQRLKSGELEKIAEMNAAGVGQARISLALGRSQSFISRVMRKNAIPTQVAKGSNHSRWKGGRYLDGSGYFRIWIDRNDPLAIMALHDGHVLEHRLVLARSLGRALARTETVHHINGNRADNRLDNLQLRQGKHGKHMVLCCLECGSRNVGPVNIADA